MALIAFSVHYRLIGSMVSSFGNSHCWRLLRNCLMCSILCLITHLICLMVGINGLELTLSLFEFIGSATRRKHAASTDLRTISRIHRRLSLVRVTSEVVNCDLLIYYLSWVSIKMLTSVLHIALNLSIILFLFLSTCLLS